MSEEISKRAHTLARQVGRRIRALHLGWCSRWLTIEVLELRWRLQQIEADVERLKSTSPNMPEVSADRAEEAAAEQRLSGPAPESATAKPRRTRRTGEAPSLNEDELKRLHAGWDQKFPKGAEQVDETIALALSHDAAWKYRNTHLYVKNWLRREAEREGRQHYYA